MKYFKLPFHRPYLNSTLLFISSIPLIILGFPLSSPILVIFGMIFLGSACFLILFSYYLENHPSRRYLSYSKLLHSGILLLLWRIIFIPYHELLHYTGALLVPIADPQRIYWQSTYIRPVTHIKMKPYVVDYESIFQFSFIRLIPVIVSFYVLMLLWPWIKVTALEFIDRYKERIVFSYTKIVTIIVVIEIVMIFASSSSDILTLLEYLNRMIQVNHLMDVIRAVSMVIFILLLGLILSFLVMKYLIYPFYPTD